MSRIAIIGPGAIGSVMAAWLASTGRHEIVVCARTPLEELLVETPSGPMHFRPHVLIDPKQGARVDWILVTTKAYAVKETALWFSGLRGPETPVAILQNGVEHRERFSSFLPTEFIVPVMVDCPAERLSPKHVRQRGRADLAAEDNRLGRAFGDLFAETPVQITYTADLKTTLWRKLCTNVVGVISAILCRPAGVMRDEAIGEAGRQLIRECIAVGRAEGATLDDTIVDQVLKNYRQAPPDSVNSLHADRAAGRPMELDARNGVVVRLGLKHGIPTPANQLAIALLTAMTTPEISATSPR